MAHSNQIREFLLTDAGHRAASTSTSGPEGVLTGSCGWRRRRASRPRPCARAAGDRAPRSASSSASGSALEAQIAALRSRVRRPRRRRSERSSRRTSSCAEERRGDARPHGGEPPRRARPTRTPRPAAEQVETPDESKPRRRDAAEPEIVGPAALRRRADARSRVAAFANLKRICEEHLAGPLHDRGRSTCSRTRSSPQATRSSPSRRWCASCRSRSARSSATSRTPSARCGRLAAPAGGRLPEGTHRDEPSSAASRGEPAARAVRAAALRHRHDAPLDAGDRVHQAPICEEHLPGRYDLEVIDIYQQPAPGARADQIIAAPTLVKEPRRRCAGWSATSPTRRACCMGSTCSPGVTTGMTRGGQSEMSTRDAPEARATRRGRPRAAVRGSAAWREAEETLRRHPRRAASTRWSSRARAASRSTP